MTFYISAILAATLTVSACQHGPARQKTGVESLPQATSLDKAKRSQLNPLAERYVKLVLAVGQHDKDYVDAYYGPAPWQQAASQQETSLAELQQLADQLVTDLKSIKPFKNDIRYKYLLTQATSMQQRVSLIAGNKFSFDEESQALYGALAPLHDEAFFSDTLKAIDLLLPGDLPLAQRVEEFRQQFVIPKDKIETVFNAALAECRQRTLQQIKLPAGEKLRLEYVTNKAWSGYNWYQGKLNSLIQINIDLPIFIERAVDLGCHEAYPGHHTYNVLLEDLLVNQHGWVEFSVYPLFSPQSLIAEGTANYGIELAFSDSDRRKFHRNVLFPLATIDESLVDQYFDFLSLLERLDYADNYAARRYLDGDWDRQTAVEWMSKYKLSSKQRSNQRVDFFETYRAYVINYNLGQDLVRNYIKKHSDEDSEESRWQSFIDILSTAKLPDDLKISR